MRRWTIPFSLLIGSTLLAVVASEVLIRALISRPHFDDPFLMWSEACLLGDPETNAVHYLPNKRIREVLVADGKVEYDFTFPTNDFGAVDSEDYLTDPPPAFETSYAVLGDSFAAGMGGGPWVSDLRSALRDAGRSLQLYNLAVAGASIKHFLYNARAASRRLRFDEILLFAISDDFHRLYWRPLIENDEVRMCPGDEELSACRKRAPTASIISVSSDTATILANAEFRRSERLRYELPAPATLAWYAHRLLGWSRAADLLVRLLDERPVFALAEQARATTGAPLQRLLAGRNEKALKALRNEFPNRRITLIHIPEREEAIRREFRLPVHQIAERVGIGYRGLLDSCPLTGADYHRADTHPTAEGYRKIAACIRRLLSHPGELLATAGPHRAQPPARPAR